MGRVAQDWVVLTELTDHSASALGIVTGLQFLPMLLLAHAVLPTAMANGVISGSYSMYVVYDTMHYALHHTKLPEYVREQKRYHLEHHYKNYELGFGVTSKIWDYVFHTVLV